MRYAPRATAAALVVVAGVLASGVTRDPHHGNSFGWIAFASAIVVTSLFASVQWRRRRHAGPTRTAAVGLVGGLVLATIVASSITPLTLGQGALAILVFGLGAAIVPLIAVAAALVVQSLSATWPTGTIQE